MAFGQPSGPPATARQVRELTALVEAVGHTDLRDARGPLGLTQRQAGGRFTRDEAEALIARLEAEVEERDAAGGGDANPSGPSGPSGPVGTSGDGTPPAPSRRAPRPSRTAAPRTPSGRPTTLAEQLERVPEELLVDELRRRGWKLVPPSPAT